ncbi:Abortive infection bacteriophage resistance protein [Brachyspira hampsonii 30599]|nr:Abortive infection bacteriophage resistance protein [Brachyspira hampsonii 30599]
MGDIFYFGYLMDIKCPYKYEEQLQKLKDRGCIINNDQKCISILESVNYYRFSAYFLPFKQNDGNYINGTSFEKVFNIYEFDRKLHTILFNALEEIEIFIRAKIAYYHAHKYGALGYWDETNFYNKNSNQKYINKNT